MKTVPPRAATLVLLFLAAVVVAAGPAAARAPSNQPPPTPTETPIYFPMTAPTPLPAGLAAAAAQPALMASSVCQNDRFLAERAVPLPQRFDVSVCGLVWAVSPGQFELAIDGTRLIPVSGKDAGSVQPGEMVFVVGTYENTPKSVETIDATGGVSPLPALDSTTTSS